MFKLGYDKKKNGIVIPYPGRDYCTVRLLAPHGGHKYDKPPADNYGGEPLFICGDKKSTLFICEGQIDAITLAQAGAGAVAAIGGAGVSKLENLKAMKVKRAVYVADNDEPGLKTADKVLEIIKDQGIVFVSTVAPEGYKDINEAWVKDPDSITRLIVESEATVREYDKSDNVAEYLEGAFDTDVETFIKYKDLKTGYKNLDEVQNFYPGFYVIGAISSLGKTTFTHQLADQIASTGKPVIIFSLEQNKLELVSKGLARELSKITDDRLTAIQIRKGMSNAALENAKRSYVQAMKNEYIVEGGFNTTMKDIEDYIKDFLDEHEEQPVVIIDYLQIIQPADPRQGTKEYIDAHVRALKKLQSKNELVLIAISSLNRANYISPVDFESFKESGAIEYTADVVWGLQLSCLNDDLYDKANKIVEKRKKVSEAMQQDPREVELVCLKNRYGKSRYKCLFNYFPAYDYFVPANDFRILSDSEKKNVKVYDWDDDDKDPLPNNPRTVI